MSDNVIPISASMANLKKTMQASLEDLEKKRQIALGRRMIVDGLAIIRDNSDVATALGVLRDTLAAIEG